MIDFIQSYKYGINQVSETKVHLSFSLLELSSLLMQSPLDTFSDLRTDVCLFHGSM